MTTLMTYSNSEGSRRCDAKCHNATNSTCNCICGGKNHGVGEDVARDNVQEYAERELKRLADDGDETAGELLEEIYRQARAERQLDLFGDPT